MTRQPRLGVTVKTVASVVAIGATLIAGTGYAISWFNDVPSRSTVEAEHISIKVKAAEDVKDLRKEVAEQMKGVRQDIADGRKETNAWLRQIYGKVK